ncbi:probable cytochrome P450 9f2 [Uranotaenia lowii]|uniref:probable cytochrome P450 9f2 n=1 Tax=Uranotaenia lowii TaxID=190385 RepID=UPI00247A044D|nr:probable cytochrome P450 9f2 [Uranotaenia lowii]
MKYLSRVGQVVSNVSECSAEMDVSLLTLAAVVAILALIYRRVTRDNDYFHDKPIPSMPVRFWFGSTAPLLTKKYSFNDFIKLIYDKYQGVKVFGLHDTGTRIFALRDPELIKKIAVKDFDHFVDRRPVFGDAKNDSPKVLFSKTLVSLTDQKWRDMRATLSPAFTGSKMRAMFDLIVQYNDKLIPILKQKAASSGHVDFEMKDFFTRIANDIIATCAFGLQVESVKSDNEFYLMGKKMMNFNRFIVLVRVFGFRLFPKLMAKLDIDIVDAEQNEYFTKIINEAVRTRDAHGIVRPDMIHLLMQARKGNLKHHQETGEPEVGFATVEESQVGKVATGKTMTDSEFIAQCLIFFLAGFDTVSTVMMFLAYELALNQDIQQKVFEEIQETDKELAGKPLTYDTLHKMKYLDMVVSEGLRMWPVAAVDRLCVRDYTLDDGEGLRFTIDKGTVVWFPVFGIHRDPKYYPNPEKFDPERFSEANKANINLATYLPFGIGPRNCIGSRFALMEIKAIMYALLLSFRIERNEKTQVPVQLTKGFVGLGVQDGMHLRFKSRS